MSFSKFAFEVLLSPPQYSKKNDYNYHIKKTSCYPSDTGTLIRRFQTLMGCDSIVTFRTVLTSEDTTLHNIYTCRLTDTGSVLLKLKSEQGCDSFIWKRTLFSAKDTTVLIFTSCFPKDTGRLVEYPKNGNFTNIKI